MLNTFADDTLKGCIVQIVSMNFDEDILLKFENIGVYPGQLIRIQSGLKQKNIVLFEVNNVEYGIRRKDALKIQVKKVEKDVCLFV